ncbi:MAG TPA: MFS transporter [Polyangiaceae bacterium]|nr:MFS transporter [Polyangiaceae bacterium]
MTCYLVAWLDRMAINMTVLSMQRDLGIDAAQTGWVLSAFFAGYALCQVPGGLLADRFGPRAVIVGALLWWTLFTAATGLATTFGAMLAVRFLFGVGEGLFPAAVWKVIGQWFTKKNRATANSLVLSSIAIGPALTPLLLAPVLQAYGWRVAFYSLGAAGLAAVGLAWRFIHDSRAKYPGIGRDEVEAFERDAASADAGAERGLENAGFRELFASRAVWALFFTALAGNITMYGWLNWLPTYLTKVKGLDVKGMALGASLPFAVGAVGLMLSGYASDRWFRGRRRVLVLACQSLGGLALFGFTRVADAASFMTLQCVAGFLLFMATGAIWAMPMVLLPPRLMGAGSGFINMGGQIGGFVTNLLIGYTIQRYGGDYAAGFNVLFAGLFLAAGCVLFGIREAPRALGPAPAPAG